jgi:hypothetical protein
VSGYNAMIVEQGVATKDDLAGFAKALRQMP